MKEPSKKTLILGLGNPLSGDDRFGAQVLELLHKNRIELSPGISLADAHTDLLNHIESFSEYDHIVLIDAVLDPEGKLGEPGRILTVSEEAFLSWPETSQSVHQMSPLLAIKLFRVMHPAAQTQITLVGLLVDRIDMVPHYVTPESVQKGAAAIQALIG